MPVTPGRRGIRKAPAIPADVPPELKAFFEQVLAYAGRHVYQVDGWYRDNVAASLTNTQLTRLAGTAADEWIAPRNGTIRTLWIFSTGARTAGTLTVAVFKNAAQLGVVTAVLDGVNTTYKATQAGFEDMPFNAGDQLDLRITTTAGWMPVTADVRAGIEVEI
jgi:hypothetical protein